MTKQRKEAVMSSTDQGVLDVARSGVVVLTGTNTSTTANRIVAALLVSSLETAVTVSICKPGTRAVAVRWSLSGIQVLVAKTPAVEAGVIWLPWEWPCDRSLFAAIAADSVYATRDDWLADARVAGDQLAWVLGAGEEPATSRLVRVAAHGFPAL
jgi:hypothetical protein